MTRNKKEKVRLLIEKQGIPIILGDSLSSLSVLRGWTYDDLELHQELHGETKITSEDFGFNINDCNA